MIVAVLLRRSQLCPGINGNAVVDGLRAAVDLQIRERRLDVDLLVLLVLVVNVDAAAPSAAEGPPIADTAIASLKDAVLIRVLHWTCSTRSHAPRCQESSPAAGRMSGSHQTLLSLHSARKLPHRRTCTGNFPVPASATGDVWIAHRYHHRLTAASCTTLCSRPSGPLDRRRHVCRRAALRTQVHGRNHGLRLRDGIRAPTAPRPQHFAGQCKSSARPGCARASAAPAPSPRRCGHPG